MRILTPPASISVGQVIGADLRRFDRLTDTLDTELVKSRLARLAQRGMQPTPIDADFNFEQLFEKHPELLGADENASRTNVGLARLAEAGVRVGYHATDLLSWNLFFNTGIWLANPTHESYLGFHITKELNATDGGGTNILKASFGHGYSTVQLLEDANVELTERELRLADSGILLGVVLAGYEEFTQAQRWGLIQDMGDATIAAVLPPPKRFLHALAVDDPHGRFHEESF